jgi:flagellar hook-associated protein 3 FlgL
MRVTFNTSFRNSVAEINRAAEELAEAQQQMGSGVRIGRPSDDPSGASAAISQRATLSTLDAYTKTTDTATTRLTVVDGMLTDIISKITAAQTAVASASGSLPNQGRRDAAAAALQGISDALLGDFNTKFNGPYLFSGSKATTAPYTAGAGGTVSAYQGDSTTMSVDIDQGRTLQLSFDGGSITKGSDTTDVFTVLSNLVTAAKAGDSDGLAQGLAGLGRAFDRATLAQTQVGTGLNALNDARAGLGTDRVNVTAQLSNTEEVNMAQAITRMTQADTAYRAALGAFGKIGSMSLMDFLR